MVCMKDVPYEFREDGGENDSFYHGERLSNDIVCPNCREAVETGSMGDGTYIGTCPYCGCELTFDPENLPDENKP